MNWSCAWRRHRTKKNTI